jgi:hypothetical protein
MLLIDSDAFVLLAGAGLLDAVIELAGFDLKDARRLAPLPHMLRGRHFAEYPEQCRVAAETMCKRVLALLESPSAGSSAWVTDERDINAGEALLIATMLDDPAACLLTGDKRALRSIAANPRLAAVAAALRGRVICVEVAIRELLRAHDIERVARAFGELRSASTMLRVVFSDGNLADPTRCLGALEPYVLELDRETAGLLWTG